MTLDEKISYSIGMLQNGERLALSINPEFGYYLAFSGGKDSQVLYALAKMAGVRFRAFYNVTSIDPPENVYFIRKNYTEVEFVHPKENFFKLVRRYGLPLMHYRFCCARLKEGYGAGCCVLTGVRAQESRKRASMHEIEVFSRRKEHAGRPRERTFDEMLEAEHQCIKGKDRVMVRPLFNWSEDDVWTFIECNHLPINPCYSSVGRVGCMFCPFASREQREMYLDKYPLYKSALLRSLYVYWNKFDVHALPSPDVYLDWWLSGVSLSKYLKRRPQYDVS